jgi:glyoxylase-like metal-dependent hydrolase (beta-lactamase superfamily II)
MKLYLLDLGYMELDMNFVVANTTFATADNLNVTSKWGRIPMVSALIITDDGKKIIYDCGSNYDGMNGYWRELTVKMSPFYYKPEQKLNYQLGLCGVKASEIDTLIISHMHLDHIGNIELFKDAQVIVDRKEFAHALSMVHASMNVNEQGFYVKQEVTAEVRKYTLVDGDTYICEGLEVISLPGHSAGVLGLKVYLPNTGLVIMSQDACYTAANYGPPSVVSGVAYDTKAYFESLEKLRQISAREKASMIVFGHDINQFNSLKRAPEYYD